MTDYPSHYNGHYRSDHSFYRSDDDNDYSHYWKRHSAATPEERAAAEAKYQAEMARRDAQWKADAERWKKEREEREAKWKADEAARKAKEREEKRNKIRNSMFDPNGWRKPANKDETFLFFRVPFAPSP